MKTTRMMLPTTLTTTPAVSLPAFPVPVIDATEQASSRTRWIYSTNEDDLVRLALELVASTPRIGTGTIPA